MNINEYPAAIANLSLKLLELTNEIESYKLHKVRIEAEVDESVAFDATLKNDSQRKSQRSSVLATHDLYQEIVRNLNQLTVEKEKVIIENEKLRSELSLLKLDRREAIARMELQAAT